MSAAALTYARQRFADLGVEIDQALNRLQQISLSVHCWQGDDVGGFEVSRELLGGGLAVTGHHPGKARTPDELRADFEFALKAIPGNHRFSLHASYAETGGRPVTRDALSTDHFRKWIDWARSINIQLDFNPTFFSHPLAASGYTLAHSDQTIRDFWIAHAKACRRIASDMGHAQGTPCVNNLWIPDGSKDQVIDRVSPRHHLLAALDEIYQTHYPDSQLLDAVEAKLFGLGSESYVVGSHEFYLGYAATRRKVLCLDAGHFHPTESIADKISSVLAYVPRLLLHVSRGVRWDSDHVVIQDDPTTDIARELVRGSYLERTHIGLDYFDASINRVAAWIIGSRAILRALLVALLEPHAQLTQYEQAGDFTRRLALLEEARTLPWGIVWDHYCETSGVPAGFDWMDHVAQYEQDIQSKRG